jgi:tetratricopeptide (TPR) repeat protein
MEPVEQVAQLMERPPINRPLNKAKSLLLLGALVLISCTNQSSISARYLTAEKLWTEKKYEAAVAEFDRIVKENPGSAIALQALWRASITRALFLKDYSEALKGLQSFSEQSAQPNLVLEAQKEIGEILYSKTQQHQAAIDHYQKLIESGKYPDDEGLFTYRISRCWVSLGKIKRAISLQEEILKKYKDQDLLLKTKMDLAQNWYTIGDVEKQAYSKAIEYYKQVSNETKGKDKRRFSEALFGTAIVLEEMDKPEEAIELYKMIEADYHVPNVVRIRIQKINDRNKRKKI